MKSWKDQKRKRKEKKGEIKIENFSMTKKAAMAFKYAMEEIDMVNDGMNIA